MDREYKSKYKSRIVKGKEGWDPRDGKIYKALEKSRDYWQNQAKKLEKQLLPKITTSYEQAKIIREAHKKNNVLLYLITTIWQKAVDVDAECGICGEERYFHDEDCEVGALEDILIHEGLIPSIGDVMREREQDGHCSCCDGRAHVKPLCPTCGVESFQDCGDKFTGGHK